VSGHARRRVLTVGCRADASQVTLHITDTGPGVAPEHRESIFNPFFTTRDEGTGLGLAISHELVRRHDGELRLGDGGGGATFVVTLPTP
jgi:signal transduction histidine kinase